MERPFCSFLPEMDLIAEEFGKKCFCLTIAVCWLWGLECGILLLESVEDHVVFDLGRLWNLARVESHHCSMACLLPCRLVAQDDV